MKLSDADMRQAEELMNRPCARMELVRHVAKAIQTARYTERKRAVQVCERIAMDTLPMHRVVLRRAARVIRLGRALALEVQR